LRVGKDSLHLLGGFGHSLRGDEQRAIVRSARDCLHELIK
jgi:hypothetical protein